jgi:hypothetical protein
MNNCKHPHIEGECFNGLTICCKYCNLINGCLNWKGKAINGKGLCPYIDNETDLKIECPFEN